jgi:hypothetical protein
MIRRVHTPGPDRPTVAERLAAQSQAESPEEQAAREAAHEVDWREWFSARVADTSPWR